MLKGLFPDDFREDVFLAGRLEHAEGTKAGEAVGISGCSILTPPS